MRKAKLNENLSKILNEIKDGHNAHLIAVSKTKPASDIDLLYQLGQSDFGENKVQELFEKSNLLISKCPDIRWHFIGHLQSNKINMLLKVPNLKAIHSIDSIQLLEKILTKRPMNTVGLFLQVNTSMEDEKSGFESLTDLENAIELILKNENYVFQGLMTIGKIRTQNFEEDAQISFAKLSEIKNQIQLKYNNLNIDLSMGMSSDYKIALLFGTNWVRIGSSIFGERS